MSDYVTYKHNTRRKICLDLYGLVDHVTVTTYYFVVLVAQHPIAVVAYALNKPSLFWFGPLRHKCSA